MRGDRPIRILRLIARLNIGGPAIQAVSLSEALYGFGYETMLLCGRVGPSEGDMSYLVKDVRPHVLPELGREISPGDDLAALSHVRRVIRRFKPDIVHTHTAKAGTIGRTAVVSLNLGRRSEDRIRLVHTFHGHVFHSYFHPLKTAAFIGIERFLAKFTHRIIVISDAQKRDICERFRVAPKRKVRMIPLGFDLTPFAAIGGGRTLYPSRGIASHEGPRVLVGIVGRLTHVKNHRLFLQALQRLRTLGVLERFAFRIIGDGELRESLEAYARELGVGDAVLFAGWKRDMASVYAGLDAVVLTSLNEGTPVTLIEAMASGKPVVSTGVGGVPDLLGEVVEKKEKGFLLAQRGIRIPLNGVDALAHALLFISENPVTIHRMTGQAREWVWEHYSQKRLVKDMDALYRELLVGL